MDLQSGELSASGLQPRWASATPLLLRPEWASGLETT